ncbi:MAG: response regulator [Flavobacteriales bacterium]|jgi:DNA-binding response OmpR family regulator|nr:response regulator [Flavobacteriales bacterium]MCB0758389.1 response regulator [Flavobacteriales bacterium]
MDPEVTSGARRTTVMVVDDDRDLLWLLSRVLRKKGFHVQGFFSAPSVETVKKIDPAVLFLDVEIGGESGEVVCERIKHSTDLPKFPVILISSHAKERLRETAQRCGADGYLTKPFNLRGMAMLAKYYVSRPPAI